MEIQKFSIQFFVDLVILLDVEKNHFTPRPENYIYKNKDLDFSLIYKISQNGFGIQGEHDALKPFLENLEADNPEIASTYVKHYIPIFDVLLKAYHVKNNQNIIYFD